MIKDGDSEIWLTRACSIEYETICVGRQNQGGCQKSRTDKLRNFYPFFSHLKLFLSPSRFKRKKSVSSLKNIVLIIDNDI